MTWHVPFFSLAHRARVLRENAEHARDLAWRSRLLSRAEMLDALANRESADLYARPLLERAPALAKWADKIRTNPRSTALERAAADELAALAYEEVGMSEDAARERRHAAYALGAVRDVAGFHTDPHVLA